jgi:uncharacterized membrane protein
LARLPTTAYNIVITYPQMTDIKKSATRIFWTIIILLSSYYFYRAINYRFFKEGIGHSFWNKQFWFVSHLLTAILPLALGPFQFWNWFRKHHVKWHRLLGKLYILGCVFGGLTALYLGYTQPYEGSIVPVMILAILWLFMTISAWVSIKNRDIEAHRLFMIRSYALTLVFVFLRILGDLVENHGLLSFIANSDIRDTTQEWLSWIVPLLVVEAIISWLPSLSSNRNKRIA